MYGLVMAPVLSATTKPEMPEPRKMIDVRARTMGIMILYMTDTWASVV